MFNRLFTPKWEHADPRVRCKALESGTVPPEAVARAAREDDDPEVRRCAIGHLADFELLAELADTETVTGIREAAGQRRRALLAGPLDAGPPLAPRLEAIRRTATPELCMLLTREAQAAEIRTAALEQVNDTDVLCAIAVEDDVAGVRRAALEQIEDPRGWEVVAREARKRDKQVSRIARERLEAYRKAQSDRESAERLCVQMEELAAGAPVVESRMHLRRLAGQWGKLESRPSPQLAERFARAQVQAAAEIERLETARARRRAICEDLEGLLRGLNDSEESDAVSPDDLLDRLAEAMGRWEALAAADDDEPLATRFTGLAEQVRREAEHLARDRARAVPLRALVQQGGVLRDDPAELDARRVKELQHRWTALERPASRRLAEALQHDFDGVLQALRERLDQQIRQRQQALEAAEDLLADLEEALKQGELESALSLRDRIRHQLKTARGVDERKRVALRERLQEMQPRLEDLRQWRHWGSGNARERLCAEIEALADSILSATEIAARVRNARDGWKRIDHAEGPARQALWQRFDQACTRAYEPYQRERREEKARLDAHLERKQALCRELDAFERDTDWKHVDWRAADQRVRKARQHWRRVGPVPGKARKALEKNWREVLARLESRLELERERELRRRQALIARVQELATATDRRAASQETKEAQEQWRPTVQAAPREERALWKQFRDACDAVFRHIKEERQAEDAEHQANLDRKTALCDTLEALLDNEDMAHREIAKRFAESGREWAGIGSVPRKSERDVAARYEMLKQRLTRRRQQEAKAAAEAVQQGVRERSRLCECLETGVLDATLAESDRQVLVEEIRQAWEALEALNAPQDGPLRERFELAGRALSGDGQARQALLDGLQENLGRRLDLCLHMEVAAGIDSPTEFAQERMRLQVARLSDALHHKLDEARAGSSRLRELQMDWYQTGPVPREAQASLEERFGRVVAAMGPAHPDS